jgi:hypothetical protein
MAADIDTLFSSSDPRIMIGEFTGVKKISVFLPPGHSDPVELNRAIEDFHQRVHEMGGVLKIEAE